MHLLPRTRKARDRNRLAIALVVCSAPTRKEDRVLWSAGLFPAGATGASRRPAEQVIELAAGNYDTLPDRSSPSAFGFVVESGSKLTLRGELKAKAGAPLRALSGA